MTDIQLWWNQQIAWGFKPILRHFEEDHETITIETHSNCSPSFTGYVGLLLAAEFDLDGNFIEAGVWE